jgi:hypothetical protein
VCRHEDYELLELAMKDFWADVAELKRTGIVLTEGSAAIPIRFKLSGDLKFIWTVLGFSLGAGSEFRCIFCEIHKDHFGCAASKDVRDLCREHKSCSAESFRKCTRNLSQVRAHFTADRKERNVPEPPSEMSEHDGQQLRKQYELRKSLMKMKMGEVQTEYRKACNGVPNAKKAQLIDRIVRGTYPLSESIRSFVTGASEKKHLNISGTRGFTRRPLVLGIELEDIVLDLLHLLLRIGDRLFMKLIQVRCTTEPLQRKLVEALDELGISYRFWRGEDGELKWTNLSGTNLTTSLSRLSIVALLGEEHGAPVEALWREFMSIYRRLNEDTVPNLIKLQEDIDIWISRYLKQFQLHLDEHAQCVDVEEGMYSARDVTPYIHMLTCHIVPQIADHGSLRQYSCQTIEHVNHVNQLVFFRMTARGGGKAKTSFIKQPETHIMNYHLRQQHFRVTKPVGTTNTVYHCEYCGKMFKRKGNLSNHNGRVGQCPKQPAPLA